MSQVRPAGIATMAPVVSIFEFLIFLFRAPQGDLIYVSFGLALLIAYSASSFALGIHVAFAPFYYPNEAARAHWKDFNAEFVSCKIRLLRGIVGSTLASWIGIAALAVAGPLLWSALADRAGTGITGIAAAFGLVTLVALPLVVFFLLVRRAIREQAFLKTWGRMLGGWE